MGSVNPAWELVNKIVDAILENAGAFWIWLVEATATYPLRVAGLALFVLAAIWLWRRGKE